MTVNIERIKAEEKAVEVAVKQITWLFEGSRSFLQTTNRLFDFPS